MVILNDTPFTLAPLAGRVDYPRRTMTLIVKGTFDLRPGETAVACAEQPYTSGDLFYDGDDEQQGPVRYESDFAYFKPRADLLLVGTCYPPARPARECQVKFRVGSTSRTLRVVGDRHFEKGMLRGAVTHPTPFESMEIRAENAFGGSDSEENPAGRGTDTIVREGKKIQPLPNIEDPREPITSPKSRPAPAFFGPLNRMWKHRRSRAGTYDDRWKQERWPWFPEDFDWGHANAAPPQMQVEGYVDGDEEIELLHLHPEHPVYTTTLPGVRIRAFANQTTGRGADTRFAEIEMNLDTVWVDADNEKLVLLWRGVQRVQSDELEDVAHIYVGSEEVADEPAPASTWRQRFDRRLAELQNAPAEEDEEESPRAEESAGETTSPTAPVDEPEDEEDRAADQELADLEAQAAALGIDVQKQMEELIAKAGDDFMRPDEADAAEEKPAERPWTRDRVCEVHASGGDLAGVDLSGLDLAGVELPGIDLTGAILAGASLEGANLAGAILARAGLSGAKLGRANLRGANLAGAAGNGVALRGALLDDADLTEVELAGAEMTEASLRGATFEGAALNGARLDRCNADKADFSRAHLRQASFRGAQLAHADLSVADLADARFDEARMTGAVLEGANAERAGFAGADLTNLRASEGARFAGATFAGASAAESIWSDSDLSKCALGGVDLTRADFTGSKLIEARLSGAILREARLLKADLRRAHMDHVDLFDGSLEKADASAADLRGANLYQANVLETIFEGARLEGANLGRTLLERRRS